MSLVVVNDIDVWLHTCPIVGFLRYRILGLSQCIPFTLRLNQFLQFGCHIGRWVPRTWWDWANTFQQQSPPNPVVLGWSLVLYLIKVNWFDWVLDLLRNNLFEKVDIVLLVPNFVLDQRLWVKKWQNFDWPIVADVVDWSGFELFSDCFPRNHQVNWLQVLLSSLFLDQEWNHLINAGPLLIVNNNLIAFFFKSFLTFLLTEAYA